MNVVVNTGNLHTLNIQSNDEKRVALAKGTVLFKNLVAAQDKQHLKSYWDHFH